jgi:opacity protein-like surface antigen
VRARAALTVLLAALASGARAQTMLDQEQRLIELHSLLVALPALEAPGALAPLQPRFGLEVITIPVIDGTTGGKTQITASDQARAFPRLRAAVGLPLGSAWRAFAGLAYVPPVEVNRVSSHMLGLEVGAAWTRGPFAAGFRLHGEWADSRSPVTEPATRDKLMTSIFGGDLSAGWRLDFGRVALTPYAGVGVARVDGTFTVTGDGYQLTSKNTDLALAAGVRLLALGQVELVAELVAFPGVMVHPGFLIAWVPGGGSHGSAE